MHRAANRVEDRAGGQGQGSGGNGPTAAAACREIELNEGEAPEWIQLLPLGPQIVGRDGRSWTMSDPEAVVAATELPLVGDCEHATELKAMFGEEAPAKAWAEELRVEDGSGDRAAGIWARVAWTPRGAELVKNLEYRFISPVFLYEIETNEVTRLINWALTNKPNLKMTALNREDERAAERQESKEAQAMNEEQRKSLCNKLGLPEDATAEQVMAKVDELGQKVAANTEQQVRGEVVPKADYDAVLQRAQKAEQKLKEQDKQAFDARVKQVLDKAQNDRKIAPASREFYASLCTSWDALQSLEKEMEQRPPIIAGSEDTSHEQGGGGEAPAKNRGDRGNIDPKTRPLTEDEKAICSRMGLSEDEYRAQLSEVED